MGLVNGHQASLGGVELEVVSGGGADIASLPVSGVVLALGVSLDGQACVSELNCCELRRRGSEFGEFVLPRAHREVPNDGLCFVSLEVAVREVELERDDLCALQLDFFLRDARSGDFAAVRQSQLEADRSAGGNGRGAGEDVGARLSVRDPVGTVVSSFYVAGCGGGFIVPFLHLHGLDIDAEFAAEGDSVGAEPGAPDSLARKCSNFRVVVGDEAYHGYETVEAERIRTCDSLVSDSQGKGIGDEKVVVGIEGGEGRNGLVGRYGKLEDAFAAVSPPRSVCVYSHLAVFRHDTPRKGSVEASAALVDERIVLGGLGLEICRVGHDDGVIGAPVRLPSALDFLDVRFGLGLCRRESDGDSVSVCNFSLFLGLAGDRCYSGDAQKGNECLFHRCAGVRIHILRRRSGTLRGRRL